MKGKQPKIIRYSAWKFHWETLLFFALIFLGFAKTSLAATPDTTKRPSLVFIEGYDEAGRRQILGTGVIVKKGFVATNYHYITGHKEVFVFKQGESKKYECNGYLSVEEDMDIILISVPGIDGKYAKLGGKAPPPDDTELWIIDAPTRRTAKFVPGVVRGTKEIREEVLPQIISSETEECTGGPVFYQDWMIGFITAGYWDGKYYAYMSPVKYLTPLLNRSFIIKDFNSLTDQKVMKVSHYQNSLIESLTAVLWLPMEDAIRLAKKKKKKIIVDVYTDWCGWCKIMDKNTYARKRIIRFINENFYAVRFNAESRDSVNVMGQAYGYMPNSRVHGLAYSLLDGSMEYPSTVFLDDNINLLTIIPGYIQPEKMEVLLYYFVEEAYRNPGKNFQEYEAEFYMRERD